MFHYSFKILNSKTVDILDKKIHISTYYATILFSAFNKSMLMLLIIIRFKSFDNIVIFYFIRLPFCAIPANVYYISKLVLV